MKRCDYCDLGIPVKDGWHETIDPEGIEGVSRVPCPNDLIPTLPAPWIFDSYRRMWDGGKPNQLWQARAVNVLTAEEDERGIKMDMLSGLGATLEEARDALLDAMKAPRAEQ